MNSTNNDNSSFGNFNIALEDLNISLLIIWQNFSDLYPLNKIFLNVYTDLTTNRIFSIKTILDNSSSLVAEYTNLYDYTSKEWLNIDSVFDLPNSNGVRLNALYLDKFFSFIIWEVDRNTGGLEENEDDTIW